MATIPASENEFPEVKFAEGAAPGTPASGLVIAYAKSDGLLYAKDDTGAETVLGAAAHVADTTDAHDASAVSFDPTGLTSVTATEVQAAIEEIDAALAAGGIPATIVDVKGDLIVATAADTVARVAAGANDLALIADSAQAAGVKWAHPVLSSLKHTITADVTMTTAGTFYDGPSINLGSVGTWFLSGAVFLENTSATAVTEFGAKLWDGTTVESAADWLTRATNDRITLHLSGIVTLAGATTMKISAVNTQNGCTIRKSSANNNAGDKYTYLRAVRIA